MLKYWVISIVSVLLSSGCANFKHYSNERVEQPIFNNDEKKAFSILIVEQQSDLSLTNNQAEKLISSLENEDVISKVYYNETPNDLTFESYTIPVVVTIKYIHDGSKDETALLCATLNGSALGLLPYPCKWRMNYSISASRYNSFSGEFDNYFSVDRRVDNTSWLNIYGLFLYPFSMFQKDIEDSFQKDIMIAVKNYSNK